MRTPVALLALLGAGCHSPVASPAPAQMIPEGLPPPHAPPAHTVGGFEATLPAYTLQPGDEIEPCYIFPLDLTGPSHIVGGASLTVGAGMHHGNITSRPSTGAGMRECPSNDGSGAGIDVAMGGAVLFASSTQVVGSEWQHFPDGMGYRVKGGAEIVARMHYLNAGGTAITVQPQYRWYTIDEATVQKELGPFVWVYSGFHIPPLADLTVSAQCQITDPMHIVTLLPHIHRMGVAFNAGFLGGPFDGRPFLTSPGYDPSGGVMRQYDPAIEVTQGGAGDGATFTCTWHNTLDETLVEGIGNNEMCMLFGYAWPPQNAFSALARGGKCAVLSLGVPQN